MSVIVNNIRVGLSCGEDDIISAAFTKINRKSTDAVNAYVMKKSVDARRRDKISIVYSVGIELKSGEEEAVKAAGNPDVRFRRRTEYAPALGSGKLRFRPVIAGFGPAGMFAGLVLAKYGYRPLIIERGSDMDKRVGAVENFFRGGRFNPATNVQFGEGGAGTFSDGKLMTRIGDPRCDTVIKEFVESGAPRSIEREAKPHIGTDNLRSVVKNIRKKIIGYGGEIKFESRLTDLKIKNGKVCAAVVDGEILETQTIILAPGHSARDTFRMLLGTGVTLLPKPFSAGVRIEHLQKDIDRALYGKFAGHPALVHAEYQMSERYAGRAVYTFCMCPGGSVVAAASEDGGVVTNGMSCFSRSGENANCALVVSVSPDDFGTNPLDGVNFQMKLEKSAFCAGGGKFHAPCQTVEGFLKKTDKFAFGKVSPTYPAGVEPYDLNKLFPEYISGMLSRGITAFDGRLRGFAAPYAVLTGVETRTSSPVRILRGETMEADGISGLYPAGEGAGYAGGIMSAAVDGLRAAEAVMAKYAPLL